jgi:hypothetical protein
MDSAKKIRGGEIRFEIAELIHQREKPEGLGKAIPYPGVKIPG